VKSFQDFDGLGTSNFDVIDVASLAADKYIKILKKLSLIL